MAIASPRTISTPERLVSKPSRTDFFITSKIRTVVETFETFNDYINTKGDYIKLLLKMTGITYISEFAASICRDCGYGAVASQVEIFARIALLSISLPVIITLLETICGL